MCCPGKIHPPTPPMDLKVEEKNYWFHIRPSNTEPVLRIVAEGRVGEVEGIVEGLKDKVLGIAE